MQELMYYAYIAASRSRTLYVGVTGEIELRMVQHKQGAFVGVSKTYNCNRLVWFERHSFINDAISREKQLKEWSRKKKIWLIERENPAWVDLNEKLGKQMKSYGKVRYRAEKQVLRLRSAPLRMTPHSGSRRTDLPHFNR